MNDLQKQTDELLIWLKTIDHDLQVLHIDAIVIGAVLGALLIGLLALHLLNNR